MQNTKNSNLGGKTFSNIDPVRLNINWAVTLQSSSDLPQAISRIWLLALGSWAFNKGSAKILLNIGRSPNIPGFTNVTHA